MFINNKASLKGSLWVPPEVKEAVPLHGATVNSVWSSLFAEALIER